MSLLPAPVAARNPARRRTGTTAPLRDASGLAHGPLNRAVRGLLEVAHLNRELRRHLDRLAVLTRRDRRATAILAAARLATADQGGEIDQAGQALIQAGIVRSTGGTA
jgi:hypothetical protein